MIFKNINKTRAIKQLKKRMRRLQRKVSNKYQQNKNRKEYVKTSNIVKLERQIKLLYRRLTNIWSNHLHQSTNMIVKTKASRYVPFVVWELNITLWSSIRFWQRQNKVSTGKQKLLQQMRADGVEFLFGNPGTVEQGLLDELGNEPDLHYITCLHESVAVAMADGYARKNKGPGVVQLHSGVGLGNGIGMLYQALRGHSPLIVIAGEAGIRYDAMDAQMACDLVEMARPVTKYAVRAVHPDSVLRLWRRAWKVAMTPPMGPVFLSLPMDILDAENHEEVSESVQIDIASSPNPEQITVIAKALSQAKTPILLVGDGVNESDAVKELEHVAELIDAPIYGVNSSCINIRQDSSYYRGDLGHMFGKNSMAAVCNADVVLIVGTYAFPEVFPILEKPFGAEAQVYHMDNNSWEIAKNHTVTVGLWANPKCGLQMLADVLEGLTVLHKGKWRDKLCLQQTETFKDGSVPAAFLEQVSHNITPDMVIFDEALTMSNLVTAFLPRINDGTFFQTRGGSLGVGIPGALGIQLASPKETVLAFTGDGGSMYTIQALHTAARYQLPVKMVICKNGKYRLLQDNIKVYWKEQGIDLHALPDSFSLEPEVDFVLLAQSFGIEARRASTQEEAKKVADEMMAAQVPFLVELNSAKETDSQC